ncbi:MAG: heavy-metal-associated domain-containing protein [Candidatus Longimicrobiales bacterium M2_2A_002]
MENERTHGCNVPRLEPDEAPADESLRGGLRLAINGMGCVNCANRIHNALITLDGVGQVFIDHRTGQGAVYYNPDRLSTDEIVGRIAFAGGASGHRYQAEVVAGPLHPLPHQLN